MRILVVEDEPNVASVTEAGLVAQGFDVDVAFDGPSGFEMARQGDYAIILLDVMLPGMDGYSVCSQLREEGFQTPILMITAKGGDQELAEGLIKRNRPFGTIFLLFMLQSKKITQGPILFETIFNV